MKEMSAAMESIREKKVQEESNREADGQVARKEQHE